MIGLSNGVANAYTDLAAIVRFSNNGIDVRNGSDYASMVNVPYSAGQSYHVEMDVDVTSHLYDVYVTPPSGTRIQIASGYAFRSEQASVSNLTNFAYYADVGGISVSNIDINISLTNPVVPAPAPASAPAPAPSPTPAPAPAPAPSPTASGIAPQFPNILSGYTIRPPWKVAGVDYGVGITPGTVLKDPATITMPGVQVDSNAHVITVTGSNVTLNGYDFSLSGGWSVDVQAPNTTISNSNFKIGSNANFTIYGDNGSSNLSVLNSVIDGNFISDRLNNGLVYTSTSGLTVEYCLLQNGFSDFIQAQGGGQVTIMYNVLHNNGNVNAHPDWLQTLGGTFTEKIMYNTVYQTPFANTDGTQGFMMNDNGATLAGGELAYNTIVSVPGGLVSPITTINGGAYLTGSALVHDNFADSRGGTYGNESFFSNPDGFDPKVAYYNNVNMATGAIYFQNVTKISSIVGTSTGAGAIIKDPTMIPHVSLTKSSVSGSSIVLSGSSDIGGDYIFTDSIEVFDGGKLIGISDSSASGAWSFTSAALASGPHSITVRANNSFGYGSALTQPITLTIP